MTSKVNTDNFEFSKWVKFCDIIEDYTKEIKYAGVYVLAYFKKISNGNADPKSRNVVYIGETTKQMLKKRLMQFRRSAFQRLCGHSGVLSYFDEFILQKQYQYLDDKDRKTLGYAKTNGGLLSSVKSTRAENKELYIAILPACDNNKEKKSVYIKYAEILTIWNFAKQNGKLPICNSI